MTADLHTTMAADPGASWAAVASTFGVSPQAVVDALPPSMRRFADGGFVRDVMRDVAKWGDVTVLIPGPAAANLKGPLPNPRSHPAAASPIPSLETLRAGCTTIAFVERPIDGIPTASLILFDRAGAILLEILIDRDATGALDHQQLGFFRSLGDAIVPVEPPPELS